MVADVADLRGQRVLWVGSTLRVKIKTSLLFNAHMQRRNPDSSLLPSCTKTENVCKIHLPITTIKKGPKGVFCLVNL